MTTVRGARPEEPELPSGRIELLPPPRTAAGEGAGGLLMNAVPMLGSVGSIGLVATMGRAGDNRAYVAAGMFLLATLGFVAVQVDRQRRLRAAQITGSRSGYLRHLADVRRRARDAAAAQRHALTWRHPEPSALPALAEEGSRLWSRAPADPGFLQVRYGVAAQPLAVELAPSQTGPVDRPDPACAEALRRLLAVHRHQPDLPASIDLRAVRLVEVCGPREPARSLARSLVCSAAACHSPEHLAVAVLSSAQGLVHWDWAKWLPHAHSARRSDAVGPRRMVTASPDELVELLPDRPHLLLVLDGVDLPPGALVVPPEGRPGTTVVDLAARVDGAATSGRLRIRFEEGGPDAAGRLPVLLHDSRAEPVRARADTCAPATAEAFARRLTARRPTDRSATAADVVALLGLDDTEPLDPEHVWRPRPRRDRLRVPIGVGEDGAPVHLDLKESAQRGMGPHGLVVGATGSGKSELLRTLVLGLAATHSPEQLGMVLVDFKGGATFAGMTGLPHVSAVITNLAQELTLVDRMQDALSGELVRRQQLLREAGNLASLHDYERARAADPDLPPLPSLLIVVDEFSELLSAKPELLDLFVAIGRLGRSLGLHLLLASQRLEEGRLRGLESHLSYRIGLRTFSAAESRAVLGVPDAYELPAEPGSGYLRSDPTTLLRFTAAYVSGPRCLRSPRVEREPSGPRRGGLPFTVAQVRSPGHATEEVPPAQPDDGESVLAAGVRRLAGHGPAAHRIWLPPLDAPEPLDGLMDDLVTRDGEGLVSPRWRGRAGLVVPLGTVDRPREQRRDILSVDLSGAGGHAAVVGGPRSGKSTLLRTIVAGLSLTTTPREAQIFVLDFGGGTFAPLSRLPHLAGLGTRAEPDVVGRIVAEIRGVLDRREAHFRAQGVDSIETYRARRAAGRADDGYGDVFLVVDGWSSLRADFGDLETEIWQLAGRGAAYGLHVVVGATRWADLRSAMRDLCGTRLELRLGDPVDSEIDRRAAALVPPDRPGRGLTPEGLHFLAALPRVDGLGDAGALGDGVTDLVHRVAAAWPGPAGPKLRLLPEVVPLTDVRAHGQGSGRSLLLGLAETDLGPVSLDVDAEPHLLVLGDGRSGKSTALRVYAEEVTRARTAKDAQLIVVDYRRSLLGEVPEDHLLDHLTSSARALPALRDLAAYLEGRLPGPDVTPAQLRGRGWWTGAEVFVLVDDYDLVATPQGSPLHALLPLLPHARDVGLHLVVARRCGGAARAMHEPIVQSLRDLAAPGLLLSGSPDEGPLLGGLRPRPSPPGRGRLVTRDHGVEVVQIGWRKPAE